MNISDQFKYINNLIITVLDANPNLAFSEAAQDIKELIINKVPSNYLSNDIVIDSSISPVVVQIACEEARMKLADELQNGSASNYPPSVIINAISDTSLTLVSDLVAYMTHNYPSEDKIIEDQHKPHRLFSTLTGTEIKIINYHLTNLNVSMTQALDIFTGMSDDRLRFLSYYVQTLKFNLEDAFVLLSKKNQSTANVTANNTDTDVTTLSADTVAALEYSKKLSEELDPQQVAEKYLQSRVAANTATTGTMLQDAGLPQTGATLPEWSSTAPTDALASNNALPLTWSAGVTANFPTSILAYTSIFIGAVLVTGSTLLCCRFFRPKPAGTLDYAEAPDNNNNEPKKRR